MKRSIYVGALVSILALLLPVTAFAGGLMQGRVVFGGTFTLTAGEVLDGDLAVFGGTAHLEKESRVEGSVIVLGGNVELDGEVEQDLVVIGGNANLSASAVVGGDVWTVGGNVNPDGATIEGDLLSTTNVEIPTDFVFTRDWRFPNRINLFPFETRIVSYLFQSFMLAAVAVLVVAFWPKPTERVATAVLQQPIASGGLGCLTIIVGLVLAILFAITICLIPAAILLGLILVLAGIFGWVAIGAEVGRRLVQSMNQDYQPVVAAGLGTLVFALVANGFSLIPCVGWLVPFLVSSVGLGAVMLTRFGTQYYQPATVSAAAGELEDVEVPPTDGEEATSEEKSEEK
jgi:hypothetical protein